MILSAYSTTRDIPEAVVLAIGDRDDLPDLYRWTFRTAWWFDALEDIGGRLKAMDADALKLGMAAWGYDAGQVAQTLEDLATWPYEEVRANEDERVTGGDQPRAAPT